MSYARFTSDSDVYIFVNICGSIECCACGLAGKSMHFETTDQMLKHLEEHKKQGDKVPDYCIDGLEREREENDRFIKKEAEKF